MKPIVFLFMFFLSGCTTFDKSAEDKYSWYLDEIVKVRKIEIIENSNVNFNCFPLKHTIACARILPDVCTIYLPLSLDSTPDWIIKHELKHCFGWKHNIREK